MNRALLAKYENERDAAAASGDPKKLSAVETKIRAVRDDAERLLAQNDEKKAQTLLKKLIEKNVEGREEALEAVAQGRFLDAVGVYEAILLTSPENTQAAVVLCHLYLLTAQYDKAAATFRAAESSDETVAATVPSFYENLVLERPFDATAFVQLGYAYLFSGDEERAAEAFSEAMKIDPENGEAAEALRRLDNLEFGDSPA